MKKLPSDLLEAESFLLKAVESSLSDTNHNRVSSQFRFEGLRVTPIVFRLYEALSSQSIDCLIITPDTGSTALAKRDYSSFKDSIYELKDVVENTSVLESLPFLLVISPQPYDYEIFYKLCNSYSGRIFMLNGKLEDSAIGIGSVGRERRKIFLKSWIDIFWIEPLKSGALLRVYPDQWAIFKKTNNLYSFFKYYEKKPDQETIFLDLA